MVMSDLKLYQDYDQWGEKMWTSLVY